MSQYNVMSAVARQAQRISVVDVLVDPRRRRGLRQSGGELPLRAKSRLIACPKAFSSDVVFEPQPGVTAVLVHALA